jgi:hypothetical protein
VRYERPRAGGDDSEGIEVYSQGEVVPAERLVAAAGFKKGSHYHIDDGQDAINNIYACGGSAPPTSSRLSLSLLLFVGGAVADWGGGKRRSPTHTPQAEGFFSQGKHRGKKPSA